LALHRVLSEKFTEPNRPLHGALGMKFAKAALIVVVSLIASRAVCGDER
jgi:hypothetical protein